MKERTKIEFVDSVVSALPRPAFDDSQLLKPSIVASPRSGVHTQKTAVNALTRERSQRNMRRTETSAFALLPELSDEQIQTSEVMNEPQPEVITEKTQKTTKTSSAAASTSNAPAKAPCNCGCNKKSKKKKVKKSLVIETGETKVFTSCAQFDKVENKGTIELAEGAVLRTGELVNAGTIKSEHDLELHVDNLNAEHGSISSPSKITVISKNYLTVRGGDFVSPEIKFDAEGKLDV